MTDLVCDVRMALNTSLPDYIIVPNSITKNVTLFQQFQDNKFSYSPLFILPEILLFLIILVLNLPYCVVIVRSASLRNILSNILGVGLSTSYTLVGFGAILNKLLYKNHPDTSSVLLWLSQLLSALLIVIMTVECYVAVKKPLHYHSWINTGRLIKVMCACCVYSFVFSILPVFMQSDFENNVNTYMISGKSVAEFKFSDLFGQLYSIYIIVWYVGHIVPCTIAMVALYTPVLLAIRSQMRRIQAIDTAVCGQNGGTNKPVSSNGVKILSVIIILYIVTTIPPGAVLIHIIYAPMQSISINNLFILSQSFTILSQCNGICYPVINGYGKKALQN